MSKIKYMSVKKFLDLGFLFEINRRVLHPFGLALEVVIEDDDEVHLGGIWDYRDDPEGMAFAPDTFQHGADKWDAFLEKGGQVQLDERLRRLGYIEQTEPGE